MSKAPRKGNSQRVIDRDMNAVERVRLAFDLRRQRLTYREIALRCGYANEGSARNAIMRELQRCISPEVEEYRQQELEILDAIHQKVWPMVVDPNDPKRDPNLWAVDRLLALSAARRELLGLDEEAGGKRKVGSVTVRETPPGYLSLPMEVPS